MRDETENAIGKLITIDGREYMVRSWSTSDGYSIQPLGEVLALNLLVEGEDQVMTLADALVQAGWTAPGRDKDGDTFTALSREATLSR